MALRISPHDATVSNPAPEETRAAIARSIAPLPTRADCVRYKCSRAVLGADATSARPSDCWDAIVRYVLLTEKL